MRQQSSKRSFLFLFVAIVLAMCSFGQAWLKVTLENGTWGPTPTSLVLGPVMVWFLIDTACVVWLMLIIAKKSVFQWGLLLALIASAVGTYFAWGALVSFMQVV